MLSSGMLRHVGLVRTDISEEYIAIIIRLIRIGKLGTTLAVTSNIPSSPIFVNLMLEVLQSSEMPVLTRATWHNIAEDGILNRHCVCTLFLSFLSDAKLSSYVYSIMLCSLLRVSRCFGGTCCLHLQSARVSHARHCHEAGCNRLHAAISQKMKLIIVTSVWNCQHICW
jgi:hypothetical protein